MPLRRMKRRVQQTIPEKRRIRAAKRRKIFFEHRSVLIFLRIFRGEALSTQAVLKAAPRARRAEARAPARRSKPSQEPTDKSACTRAVLKSAPRARGQKHMHPRGAQSHPESPRDGSTCTCAALKAAPRAPQGGSTRTRAVLKSAQRARRAKARAPARCSNPRREPAGRKRVHPRRAQSRSESP